MALGHGFNGFEPVLDRGLWGSLNLGFLWLPEAPFQGSAPPAEMVLRTCMVSASFLKFFVAGSMAKMLSYVLARVVVG